MNRFKETYKARGTLKKVDELVEDVCSGKNVGLSPQDIERESLESLL